MEDLHKKLSMLPEAIYLPIYINDAVVEIVQICTDKPYGAAGCDTHSHTWFEFNYIFSGKECTILDGIEYEVENGQFFLVPPGVEHSHKYSGVEPHEGICIRWVLERNEIRNSNLQGETYDKLSLQSASNDITQNHTNLSGGICDILGSLSRWELGTVKDECGIHELIDWLLKVDDQSYASMRIKLRFLYLLFALCAINPIGIDSNRRASRLDRDNIVRKVELLLNDHREGGLKMDRLATSLHMSYGHLSRLYKKAAGRTIINRLTDIRLEKAVNLLENSGYSIREIAEKCEFSTQYYFSRLFKKKYGVSPLKYRKLEGK